MPTYSDSGQGQEKHGKVIRAHLILPGIRSTIKETRIVIYEARSYYVKGSLCQQMHKIINKACVPHCQLGW
jgi:hypothetical protein